MYKSVSVAAFAPFSHVLARYRCMNAYSYMHIMYMMWQCITVAVFAVLQLHSVLILVRLVTSHVEESAPLLTALLHVAV